MKVLYFSATGNSLYAAQRIGGQLLSIPKLIKEKRYSIEDEAVGVVCPVYCGEIPHMVCSYLEQAVIKTDYFFFVFTFGKSETVVRYHGETLAEKMNIKLSYVNIVKMVDNYLPAFEMNEQINQSDSTAIEAKINQIIEDISKRKEQTVKIGVKERIQMKVIHNMMAKRILDPHAAKSFIVNDSCILCGTCAQVCPADNIKVNRIVEFGNCCESCFACIHNCPQNAIHLRNERNNARYRNPHISLRDLMEANS